MNAGIKMWQEDHGGWTVCFYATKDCKDEDWWEMGDVSGKRLTPQAIEVEQWLRHNSPAAHEADFNAFGGMVQWNEKGGDTALLFKLHFAGRFAG